MPRNSDGRGGDVQRVPLEVSPSLPRQQPEEAQPTDLDESKQDPGGDVYPRLVTPPGAGGQVQGLGQQRYAILAEQLLTDLTESLGEGRLPDVLRRHDSLRRTDVNSLIGFHDGSGRSAGTGRGADRTNSIPGAGRIPGFSIP